MTIDYFTESEKYRPKRIETLLVGESPPPSGKSYFYVPKPMSNSRPIRSDTSLPATIFYHYFLKRPETEAEYVDLLLRLKENGIFLIDICDDPVRVRGNKGVIKKNLDRIIEEIPRLRNKMASRKISVAENDIIFLLARRNYLKYIREEFPTAKYFRWIDFRLSPEPLNKN